jgi:dihydroorotase
VNPDSFATRSRNTPYRGLDLPGRVHATFLRGVATVLAGELVEAGEVA